MVTLHLVSSGGLGDSTKRSKLRLQTLQADQSLRLELGVVRTDSPGDGLGQTPGAFPTSRVTDGLLARDAQADELTSTRAHPAANIGSQSAHPSLNGDAPATAGQLPEAAFDVEYKLRFPHRSRRGPMHTKRPSARVRKSMPSATARLSQAGGTSSVYSASFSPVDAEAAHRTPPIRPS